MTAVFRVWFYAICSVVLLLGSLPAAADGLCVNPDGTGGLKPEIVQESCERWTYGYDNTNLLGAEGFVLFANNPDDCEVLPSGYVECFWRDGATACKAALKAFNKVNHPDKILKTKSLPNPRNRDYWKCSWGFQGETLNSDNLYTSKIDAYKTQANRMSYCETPLSGPYNACPTSFRFCGVTYDQPIRGLPFSPKQKQMVYATNADKLKSMGPQGRGIMSDLGGYTFKKAASSQPCTLPAKGRPGLCREPPILTASQVAQVGGNPALLTPPNVHHVIPRVDRRGCPCGTNSPANAAMISNELNGHFSNFKRPSDEIAILNAKGAAPYACTVPQGF